MRALLPILAALLLFTPAARAHPQDGPHADLRYNIEPTGVVLSAGLNLAFLDTFIPPRRESPDALGGVESTALADAVRDYFQTAPLVTIDGKPVPGVVENILIADDPDPAMVGLFPKTGARALIRAVAIIRFPSENTPERVELAWHVYPEQTLAEAFAGETGPVRMFIEAQLRASGTTTLIRFSQPEPTVTWSAAEDTGPDFRAVPPAPLAAVTPPTPHEGPGTLAIACWSLAGLTLLSLAVPGVRTRAAIPVTLVTLAFLGAGFGARLTDATPPADAPRPVTQDQALVIATALHHNLYCAFDYTDESDVFDALARSVRGEALETLYDQVYASLVQAENGGELGIITRLEQLDTTIDLEDGQTRAFAAALRWRVDGTVYHAGHSHTATHEYEGTFDITPAEGHWKITGYRITSQRRIDEPNPAAPSPFPPGEI